jgi:hypothetical protein
VYKQERISSGGTIQFLGENTIRNYHQAVPSHASDKAEKFYLRPEELIKAHLRKRIVVYVPACFLEEDYY